MDREHMDDFGRIVKPEIPEIRTAGNGQDHDPAPLNQTGDTDAAIARRDFVVTFFNDQFAHTKRQELVNVDQLMARLASAKAAEKEKLPWIKFAQFGLVVTSVPKVPI